MEKIKFEIVYMGNLQGHIDIKELERLLKYMPNFSLRHSKKFEGEISEVVNIDELNYSASTDGTISIFITDLMEEDCFFSKANYIKYDEDPFHYIDLKGPILLVSSYYLREILKNEFSIEKSIASIVYVSLLTKLFMEKGIPYDEIYNIEETKIENSIFNFCSNKEHLLYSMRSGCLGRRLESVLSNHGYTGEEFEIINKAFKKILTSKYPEIRKNLATIAVNCFWAIFGVVLGVIFS